MAKKLVARKKETSKVNEELDLATVHATPDPKQGTNKAMGMLRNFVRRGADPKWGTAFPPVGAAKATYDTLDNLKTSFPTFTVNEVGEHTVVLVYLDNPAPDIWRFVQVQAEDIHATP